MQTFKRISKAFQDSQFGVYIQDGTYLPANKLAGDFLFKRTFQKNRDSIQTKVEIINKSKKPLSINSIVIADFVIKNIPQSVLEHGWQQCSKTFFRKPSGRTRLPWFFLRCDFNSFSFKPEFGYLKKSIVSEWFSILKWKDFNATIGAVTTANQFSQIYFKKEGKGLRVRVTCQFDGIIISPGQTFTTEKVALVCGKSDSSERTFASLVAKNMKVKKLHKAPRGICCSYYWLGNFVSEKVIDNEISFLERTKNKLKLDWLQIDAGYSEHFGDWLDYRKRFPGGFKKLITRATKLKVKSGIWLSPFTAHTKSKIFQKHQNWFLKDKKGGALDARLLFPFDYKISSLGYKALDPTNEEARRYIVKVVKHFRDQGFLMFKIDFLYTLCLSTGYSRPMTRAQALRLGVETIRNAAGPDVHLLSGIAPLSPLVGLVDSARVGLDALNPLLRSIPVLRGINNIKMKNNIRNSTIRNFLHQVLWTNDIDCFFVENKTGIAKKLNKNHREFGKEYETSLWIGDSLCNLKSRQLKILESFFSDK